MFSLPTERIQVFRKPCKATHSDMRAIHTPPLQTEELVKMAAGPPVFYRRYKALEDQLYGQRSDVAQLEHHNKLCRATAPIVIH